MGGEWCETYRVAVMSEKVRIEFLVWGHCLPSCPRLVYGLIGDICRISSCLFAAMVAV